MPAQNIVIEGQFATGVLGTFRIIRGFATLQDLATISAPYPMIPLTDGSATVQGHQRAIDPDHANAIKRYLQDGKLRFIPEVILSIRANFRDELDDQQRIIGVISDDTTGLSVKRRFKSKNIATHQIVVARDRLEVLVQEEKRIRRIDGNHRLHLAGELRIDTTSPTKYLAPFCAILLPSPGDADNDFVESMLFYTMNSTAMPLDSEHALRLVLGQAGDQTTPDEEFANSAPLHLTRLLKTKMDAMQPAQRERLGRTPATVLNAAAQSITAADPALTQNRQAMEAFATQFSGGLTDILTHLNVVHPQFCKTEYFIELAALAWKDTQADTQHDTRVAQAVQTLEAMGKWLGRDGFHEIQTKRSLAQQLFEIFRTVRKRIPKRIFLSRWYPIDADGDEKRKADLRKQMIDRTLNDLRGEGIDLALDDPGTVTGGTFPIHQKMYEAIANNDIILIDLSGVRPNVSIEAGYGLERHNSNRLLFLFQPTQQITNPATNLVTNCKYDNPPFDLTTFRYEKIADAAEIPDKLKSHLRSIWQEAMSGNG